MLLLIFIHFVGKQDDISQNFLDLSIYMQLLCLHPYFSQSYTENNPEYVVCISKKATVLLDTCKDMAAAVRTNVS